MDSNLSGKLLFALLGCALETGGLTNANISGSPEMLVAFIEALKATKDYQDVLKDPSSTVESISQAQKTKMEKGCDFEKITGTAWLV